MTLEFVQLSRAIALFIQAEANTCCDISQIGKATVEINPDKFHLSDTEEKWMHETQDVERHLLCREDADAIALKCMCNNSSNRYHESS
jgi:hypothetical protein